MKIFNMAETIERIRAENNTQTILAPESNQQKTLKGLPFNTSLRCVL